MARMVDVKTLKTGAVFTGSPGVLGIPGLPFGVRDGLGKVQG